jgi:hypothetical protein
LAPQQPFQAVSLSASGQSVSLATDGIAPFGHSHLPESSQPVYAQTPAFQQLPSAGQPGLGNNPYAQSGKSTFSVVPPSIYPPVASPSSSPDGTQFVYQPVAHHWFYSVMRESKEFWEPFSIGDSLKIDEVFKSGM